MQKFIKMVTTASIFSAVLMAPAVLAADEPVDHPMITKIRDEGFNRSEVMNTLEHLTDVIGPRLTGSPAMREANKWTAKKMAEWGLTNIHEEGFEFGPGWSMNTSTVEMTLPRRVQLAAYPLSWHPGTDGDLDGNVIYAPMASKKDFEKYKGKLAGKMVMVDKISSQREPSNKVFTRHDEKDLGKIGRFRVPTGNQEGIMGWVDFFNFFYEREQFLAQEGALAMIRKSPRKAFLIEASAYQHKEGYNAKIPGVVMATEHYNRMKRLLDKKMDVAVKLNVDAQYHHDDMNSYNTMGEIKGKTDEVVMIGAHLDSWFLGDGAADNGAGVAVSMEAMRILKALNVKPKRTIRIGLWNGEEQGYFGSQQYVMNHLVDRPDNTDEAFKYMAPYELKYEQFPLSKKKGYDKFSAYFNLDNGSGKIRGIYAEQNSAAAEIFEAWLKPFHDLDAKTVSMNDTGGTDHEPFDDVGLPGFQFIQDDLDYDTRLHHTQMDTFGNVYEKDLKQAAVIMASFLYHAAMRDKMMPREMFPQPPKSIK
jgi:hypothetical protein